MRKWMIVVGVLALFASAGGWAYTESAAAFGCCSGGKTIVCPLTGEDIAPCCCPLSK